MPGGPGTPSGPPGGKRPAVGLQLKLPCATLEEVKRRYGADLRQNRFFIRTRQPRPVDTLVRLEAQLSSGAPCFRAAAVVARVQAPPAEPGMGLTLLGVDEGGRNLILALGGKPPAPLKLEAMKSWTAPSVPPAPPQPPTSNPASTSNPTSNAKGAPTKPPRPMSPPARQGPMIGIDLGTTNSCAAVVRDRKPFVIPSREGYNTIPSIVALSEKGKLIVGHPAKSQLLINPRNTVVGAKRLIGRPYGSQAVTDLAGRFA